MVAFAGVVVDDVEHDLDAGVVQPLDHGLEFGDRRRRQIARLGREEADRVVAPVVGQPALRPGGGRATKAWTGSSSTAVIAERAQMVDHAGEASAGEGAAQRAGTPGCGFVKPLTCTS